MLDQLTAESDTSMLLKCEGGLDLPVAYPISRDLKQGVERGPEATSVTKGSKEVGTGPIWAKTSELMSLTVCPLPLRIKRS